MFQRIYRMGQVDLCIDIKDAVRRENLRPARIASARDHGGIRMALLVAVDHEPGVSMGPDEGWPSATVRHETVPESDSEPPRPHGL